MYSALTIPNAKDFGAVWRPARSLRYRRSTRRSRPKTDRRRPHVRPLGEITRHSFLPSPQFLRPLSSDTRCQGRLVRREPVRFDVAVRRIDAGNLAPIRARGSEISPPLQPTSRSLSLRTAAEIVCRGRNGQIHPDVVQMYRVEPVKWLEFAVRSHHSSAIAENRATSSGSMVVAFSAAMAAFLPYTCLKRVFRVCMTASRGASKEFRNIPKRSKGLVPRDR